MKTTAKSKALKGGKADFSKFKDAVKLKPCKECGSRSVHTHQ
jgi:hypothetical protein